MQRKSTELTGWQSAIQYIDDDLELDNWKKKVRESLAEGVALQQREAKARSAVRWNWLTGAIVTVCIVTAGYMLAVLWMGFHPAIRWDW